MIAWLLVLSARFALAPFVSISVLRLALVPLFGISSLYVAFYILRRVLSGNGQLHGMLVLVEKVLTTVVWLGMALYVLGVLSDVMAWMHAVRFSIGGKHDVSLASTLMAVVWILLTVLAAMWFGSWLEERLMRAPSLDANLKVVLTRIAKALLLLVSLLLSLVAGRHRPDRAVGIRRCAGRGPRPGPAEDRQQLHLRLHHPAGSLGQARRSDHGGQVHRHRLPRSAPATPSFVTAMARRWCRMSNLSPNRCQNHSFSGTNVRVATRVQPIMPPTPKTVITLLQDCVRDLPRVLPEPAPAAFLVMFADNGIEYEVAVNIADPQNGKLGVQSAMNRAIWRTFRRTWHLDSVPAARNARPDARRGVRATPCMKGERKPRGSAQSGEKADVRVAPIR